MKDSKNTAEIYCCELCGAEIKTIPDIDAQTLVKRRKEFMRETREEEANVLLSVSQKSCKKIKKAEVKIFRRLFCYFSFLRRTRTRVTQNVTYTQSFILLVLPRSMRANIMKVNETCHVSSLLRLMIF